MAVKTDQKYATWQYQIPADGSNFGGLDLRFSIGFPGVSLEHTVSFFVCSYLSDGATDVVSASAAVEKYLGACGLFHTCRHLRSGPVGVFAELEIASSLQTEFTSPAQVFCVVTLSFD